MVPSSEHAIAIIKQAIYAGGGLASINLTLGEETGIQEFNKPARPETFTLFQNYPNPFNPETTIRFGVPKEAHIRIKVYDLRGREICILVDKKFPSGVHDIQFNAEGLPSGVYIYRIQANNNQLVKKMVVLD